MELTLIFYIMVMHFLADFALQTHWQAENKSKNIKALTYHVATYSTVWLFASWIYTNNIMFAICFTITTFLIHWLTDFLTSKEVSKRFANNDYHNGFVMIGFDQVLHYTQLIITFHYFLQSFLVN